MNIHLTIIISVFVLAGCASNQLSQIETELWITQRENTKYEELTHYEIRAQKAKITRVFEHNSPEKKRIAYHGYFCGWDLATRGHVGVLIRFPDDFLDRGENDEIRDLWHEAYRIGVESGVEALLEYRANQAEPADSGND